MLLDTVTKISAQKESKYGSLMNLVKDLEDSVKKNRSQDIEEEKFTPWGGKWHEIWTLTSRKTQMNSTMIQWTILDKITYIFENNFNSQLFSKKSTTEKDSFKTTFALL